MPPTAYILGVLRCDLVTFSNGMPSKAVAVAALSTVHPLHLETRAFEQNVALDGKKGDVTTGADRSCSHWFQAYRIILVIMMAADRVGRCSEPENKVVWSAQSYVYLDSLITCKESLVPMPGTAASVSVVRWTISPQERNQASSTGSPEPMVTPTNRA